MADVTGKYKSPLHCITMTFKEGGVAAFMKGLARLLNLKQTKCL